MLRNNYSYWAVADFPKVNPPCFSLPFNKEVKELIKQKGEL